jgi:selenocysteine-specific elongation factor
MLKPRLPADGLFEHLLGALLARGYVKQGTIVKNVRHFPSLPPALQAAGKRLRAALSQAPMGPPSRKELAPDPLSAQALRFLLTTGEAVELSADTVLLSQAYARAVEIIREHLSRHGSGTASELRQLLRTNRRVIIPLLERMDREGITRRNGDHRVLR